MTLPSTKVVVEVLKNGRWAQEPSLPQLEVVKGDRVSISISFAHKLQVAGNCRILPDATKNEAAEDKGKDVDDVPPEQEKKESVKRYKKSAKG